MANILLIDDDLQIIELFTSTLYAAGYKVKAAFNGRHGMRAMDQQHFDLIITDIIMPEADGIEIISHILAIPFSERPAVIAMSGGGQRLESEYLFLMATTMHADLVLEKPITNSQLLNAVTTVLSKKMTTDD